MSKIIKGQSSFQDAQKSRNEDPTNLLFKRVNTTTNTRVQQNIESKNVSKVLETSPKNQTSSPKQKSSLLKSKSQPRSSVTQSEDKKQSGVKFRLPSKFEGRDYKQFISLMTHKIKEELQRELTKKDRAEKNEVLREEFNSRKDQIEKSLLEEFGPGSTTLVLPSGQSSQSPNKKQKSFFHINTKSYALKNIREKLDQEQLKVQGMLFLKQLEIEGRGQIVWEKSTLEIMQHMAEEKFKMENTDYERALKPRKPRPKEFITGQIQSQTEQIQQRYDAFMEKMVQNSSSKGSIDGKSAQGMKRSSLISGELEFLLRHSKRNSIGDIQKQDSSLKSKELSQVGLSPYKNLPDIRSRSLIRIEEETPSYVNQHNMTFQECQNNSTQNVSTLHQFPLEQDSRADMIGVGGVLIQDTKDKREDNLNFINAPLSQRNRQLGLYHDQKNENSKATFNMMESTTVKDSPDKNIIRALLVKGSSAYNSNSDFGNQGAFSQRIDSKENQSMMIQQNSTINTSTLQNNTSVFESQNQKPWVINPAIKGDKVFNSQKEMKDMVLQGEGIQRREFQTGTTISNEDSHLNSHRSLIVNQAPFLQTAFQQPHPQSSSLPRMAQMYQTYQSQMNNKLNLNQSQNWDSVTQNQSQSYFNQNQWAQTPGQDIAIKKMFPARNYTSNQARRNFNFIQSHSLYHQNAQKKENSQSGIMIRNQDMYKQKPSTAGRSTATGDSRPRHQNHRKLKDFMITQRLADVLVQNEIPVQLKDQIKNDNISDQLSSSNKFYCAPQRSLYNQRGQLQSGFSQNMSRIENGSSLAQEIDVKISQQPKSAQRTRNLKLMNQAQMDQAQMQANFFSGHSSLSRKNANQAGSQIHLQNPQYYSVTALLDQQNAINGFQNSKGLTLNSSIEEPFLNYQTQEIGNSNSSQVKFQIPSFQSNNKDGSQLRQNHQVKQHNFFQNNFIKSSDMRKYHSIINQGDQSGHDEIINMHNTIHSKDTSFQISEETQANRLRNKFHDSKMTNQHLKTEKEIGSALGNLNTSSFSPESIRLANRFQNSSAVQPMDRSEKSQLPTSHFKTLTGDQMRGQLQPNHSGTQVLADQQNFSFNKIDVQLQKEHAICTSSSMQRYQDAEEIDQELMNHKFMVSRFKRLEEQQRKQLLREKEEKAKMIKSRDPQNQVRASQKSLASKSQHSQTLKQS